MPKPKTRDDAVARFRTNPAFDLIIERIVIAVAPLFEEIEELEGLLHKAKHLASLTDKDTAKIPDRSVNVELATRLARTLAHVTSVSDVHELMEQHGGKGVKLKKFKKKQLIPFVRDVQYKLSYIKAMKK